MAQYFNLPYFPVTGDNFYDSINGWRKNLITDVESTIKPKFTIAQTKSDLKTNSVDYTEQKKSEALSICTEIMDNLKNNFIGFNNFPAFGTFKNNVFESSSIQLDYLVKTGQMTESQKLIELAQLNAKKSIVDNTESYWSNSLDDYKIGGVKWNEARDLFISAHETEAEGTTAFKALIKDSVFELYSNMRNVEIGDEFGDYIYITGEKNTAILAKDELLATKVSARTELSGQMDTLNVEKEDPSTTPERVTEIDVTLADLQSQIDVILAEETAISEEWDLVDAAYNKIFEWMDLRGSAAKVIADQLEIFIIEVYADNINGVTRYTKELLQMYHSKFNHNANGEKVFPMFFNSNTNYSYFQELVNLFDSRKTIEDAFNSYKLTVNTAFIDNGHLYQTFLIAKSTMLTQNLWAEKVSTINQMITAKQAQIDTETDETLLATYQAELTKLNTLLSNFNNAWEQTNGDNTQTYVNDMYNSIQSEIDNYATQLFDIDLQIVNKFSKIFAGYYNLANDPDFNQDIKTYVYNNWDMELKGMPQRTNYLECVTGLIDLNDSTTWY